MLAQTFGRLRQEAETRRGVRFERVYDYSVDELWAALTEPEQLRAWLGEAKQFDLDVGGTVRVQLGDESETVRCVVRRLEPKRLVEYDWHWPDEEDSILRFELEPERNGTRLTLDHRRLPDEAAASYGAGWHAFLDALELMLEGRSDEWVDRARELEPSYTEQIEELPPDPQLGAIRVRESSGAVRFERLLDASPERVWKALIDSGEVRGWLGAEAVILEPRVGGAVLVRWSDEAEMSGTVREFDPPRVLEYTWREKEDDSIVRFELSVSNGHTRLVLEHRDLPLETVVGYSAGWHAHLDWLEAHLTGGEFSFWPRYRELRPLYEDIAAAA